MEKKRKIIVGSIAVMAMLAVALGGSATAASQITSADIKDQTIQSIDIAKSGVGTSEVRNQSLTSIDLARGSVGASELRNGSVQPWDLEAEFRAFVESRGTGDGKDGADGKDGVDGTNGTNGKDGADGAPGITGYEVDGIYTNVFEGDEGASFQSATVECAEGKYVVGGGFSRADEAPENFKNLQIVTSAPNEDTGYRIKDDAEWSRVATGWKVEGFNNGTTDLIVRPWVICAEIPVPPAHE